MAEMAGGLGDGLISTAPEESLVERFEAGGGAGKPRYGQLTVCWAQDEASARRTAYTYWPNAGLKGELSQELPTPAYFAQTAKLGREDDVTQVIVCGPDPAKHIEKMQQYADAGYDHIYVHQVGPDQEGFFRFYAKEVLPKFQ
jgi:G6PDH family F420-dependent oxidoreductase